MVYKLRSNICSIYFLKRQFKFRKVIENWSSASQVSGGCGIYKVWVIEDNFYNSIFKNVTAFQNVGDYSLIIFSWNCLETLNYGIVLLVSPRSTTFCFCANFVRYLGFILLLNI
mgnify:CR=1 FL=1